MSQLFELVKLIDYPWTSSHTSLTILPFALKNTFDRTITALYFPQDHCFLLWYKPYGGSVVCRRMPWYIEGAVESMCFDNTGAWLMCIDSDNTIHLIPVTCLLDSKLKVEHKWRTDDITSVKLDNKRGPVADVVWWRTNSGLDIAIIAAKAGFIQLVDLRKGLLVHEVHIRESITRIDLIHCDDMLLAYLLISTAKSQWKLLLEEKIQVEWPNEFRSETSPKRDYKPDVFSILEHADGELMHDFQPCKFHQFSSSVYLSSQNAKGRHFVAAHDLRNSMFQVYESNMERSPLYVYKVPQTTEHALYTDKIIFTASSGDTPVFTIIANQLAETSAENPQTLKEDSTISSFTLGDNGEEVLGLVKSHYPFYHHEKTEVDTRNSSYHGDTFDINSTFTYTKQTASYSEMVNMKYGPFYRGTVDSLKSLSSQLSISTHTVLDGCFVITNHAVYECRPKMSPERLFLDMALTSINHDKTDRLGIMLGLDIGSLYQQAAEYSLSKEKCSQASKLLQLAKTSPELRVHLLAKHGHIEEASSYLKHVLQNPSLEVSDSSRKGLCNLAIQCYMYLHLVKNNEQDNGDTVVFGTVVEKKEFDNEFNDFLHNNCDYDERFAFEILLKNGYPEFVLKLAKSRNLLPMAVEMSLDSSHTQSDTSHLYQYLRENWPTSGQHDNEALILNQLSTPDLIAVVQHKPQTAARLITYFETQMNDLDFDLLQKLVHVFDPSTSAMQSAIQKLTLAERKRSRTFSDESNSSSGSSGGLPTTGQGTSEISKIVTFFLALVITLNTKRKSCQLATSFLDPVESEDNNTDEDKSGEYDSLKFLACKGREVACGQCHSMVITNGQLYSWGKHGNGRLGIANERLRRVTSLRPTRVETFGLGCSVLSLACGADHSLAISTSGLYAWGKSKYGQVGKGSCKVYSRPEHIYLDAQVVKVACGQYHSVALTDDCRVYTWGWGVHGQLGHGDPEDKHTPHSVTAVEGVSAVDITAGHAHTIICDTKGDVYAFGCGTFGQLGLGPSVLKSSTPLKVRDILGSVVQVTSKHFHTLALTDTNKLYRWGASPHVLRGTVVAARKARAAGHVVDKSIKYSETHMIPLLVDTSSVEKHIKQISVGMELNSILTENGSLYTWGRNHDGQLGHGHRREEKKPLMVGQLSEVEIHSVTCGTDFMMAMDSHGEIWGWGRNDSCQLGIESTDSLRSLRGIAGHEVVSVVSPVRITGVPRTVCRQYSKSPMCIAADWWFEETEKCHSFDISSVHLTQEEKDNFLPSVVLKFIKAFPQHCNTHQLVNLCLVRQAYGIAARIYMLNSLFIEAFHYQLKCLEQESYKTAVQEICGKLFDHHIRSVCNIYPQDESDKERKLLVLIEEILSFWSTRQLSTTILESILDRHFDDIGHLIYSVIQRRKSEDRCIEGTRPTLNFSTTFYLKLTTRVLFLLKTDNQSLSNFTSLLQPQGGASEFKSQIKPIDKLVPADKLWNDIIQNLKKDSKVRIDLSGPDMKSLQDSHAGSRGDDVNNNVVLFTCGHHFTRTNFKSTIDSLSRVLHRKVPALSQSASLLSSYYTNRNKFEMACPTCVANSV